MLLSGWTAWLTLTVTSNSVCCLGAIGLTDYIMKATLSGFWSLNEATLQQKPYFGWISCKFAVRGVFTAFLMFLFAIVSAGDLTKDDNTNKANYFLVPCLMLGIFSEFVGSAIDQYVGLLDVKLRCEIKEASLAVLFEAGPPMHLGFCLHVFLCFLMLQRKLTRAKVIRRRVDETTPLIAPTQGHSGRSSVI